MPHGAAQLAVDQAEQRRAVFHAVEGDIAGQFELAGVRVRGAGVVRDLERAVSRAEESRGLSRKLDDVIHHMRQRHEGRQARAAAKLLAQDRAQAGRIVRVVVQQLQVAPSGSAAAEGRKRRGIVVRHRVVHAAHDREPVRHARSAAGAR